MKKEAGKLKIHGKLEGLVGKIGGIDSVLSLQENLSCQERTCVYL